MHTFTMDDLVRKFIAEKKIRVDRLDNTFGCVYVLQCKALYKIGRTGNLKGRLNQLKTSNPFGFEVIHLIYSNDLATVEAALHLMFAESRVQGEWFNLSLRDIAQVKSMSVQAIVDLGADLKSKLEAESDVDPNQMRMDW
jgi:hypothetical protein